MLSSEDSVWGPSEELQDKAKAESDMLLWHAADPSESELRELFKYVSQDFVKNTHKHAFR